MSMNRLVISGSARQYFSLRLWRNLAQGRAHVIVRAATGVEPTGGVQVRSRGRVVGRATLRPGDGGRVVVRLARLRTSGNHRITATYLGSTTVLPSTSPRVPLRA